MLLSLLVHERSLNKKRRTFDSTEVPDWPFPDGKFTCCELGTDGFLKWDQDGQIIAVEIDVKTRFPIRWLWEESLDFENIKGDLRAKAFKQIRDTLVYTICEDTHPLTSTLFNYGSKQAMEIHSEMIPAMIEAGVFSCLLDPDAKE